MGQVAILYMCAILSAVDDGTGLYCACLLRCICDKFDLLYSEYYFFRNSVRYIISSVLLTFLNQERLFFADILFFLKSKIAATKARLKNEREERIKMEEKVKYTVPWGSVVLLTKLLFNFSTEDFLMHRSYIGGNYDCEPLLGIYPDPNLVVLYI